MLALLHFVPLGRRTQHACTEGISRWLSNGSFDFGTASRLVSCRLLRLCAIGRPHVARKSNFLACGNKIKPGGRPNCNCEKRNRRYLQPIIIKIFHHYQQGWSLHMQCGARLRQRAFLVAPIVLEPVGSGTMGDSDRREPR